jgi:hypothetical protein
MDENTLINCKGLFLSHLMLIPHYVLFFLLVVIKFFKSKQNIFLKLFYAFILIFGSFVIIPITFCMDFWALAMGYSSMSFDVATSKFFFEFADELLNSEE